MKWRQEDTLPFSKYKKDPFAYLQKTYQLWKYLNYEDPETLKISFPELKKITQIRDVAIRNFNRLMLEFAGKEWLYVAKICDDQEINGENQNLVIPSKNHFLACHICEQVLVNITTKPRTIFNADGEMVILGETQSLNFHCIVANQDNNEFEIFPVESIAKIGIFNH